MYNFLFWINFKGQSSMLLPQKLTLYNAGWLATSATIYLLVFKIDWFLLFRRPDVYIHLNKCTSNTSKRFKIARRARQRTESVPHSRARRSVSWSVVLQRQGSLDLTQKKKQLVPICIYTYPNTKNHTFFSGLYPTPML